MVIKQSSRADLKMFMILSGTVKIFRDQGTNVESLSREEVIDLKVLDQAFSTITGKSEDEQEAEGDLLDQRRAEKLQHKRELEDKVGANKADKESSLFKANQVPQVAQTQPSQTGSLLETLKAAAYIRARGRARRNTKIDLGESGLSTKRNISEDINRWGEAALFSWSHEFLVLFIDQNKEHLLEMDSLRSPFKKMKSILSTRKEFIRTYYTDFSRARRTYEVVLKKYLGSCLRQMGVGEIFGERSLEHYAPRSASVVAETDCE